MSEQVELAVSAAKRGVVLVARHETKRSVNLKCEGQAKDGDAHLVLLKVGVDGVLGERCKDEVARVVRKRALKNPQGQRRARSWRCLRDSTLRTSGDAGVRLRMEAR